jgi:hypothetical protein
MCGFVMYSLKSHIVQSYQRELAQQVVDLYGVKREIL